MLSDRIVISHQIIQPAHAHFTILELRVSRFSQCLSVGIPPSVIGTLCAGVKDLYFYVLFFFMHVPVYMRVLFGYGSFFSL